MADITQGTYGSTATVLSTELNSIADAASSDASSEIDNTTDLHMFDDLVLSVTFGSAPTASEPIELYLLPAIDGTNFVTGSSSITPPLNTLRGVFTVQNTTSAQLVTLMNVAIPPGKFKYMITNNSGQAFPASGSTLERRPHSFEQL